MSLRRPPALARRPSGRPSLAAAPALGLAAAVAVVALTGCGVGQKAQVYRERTTEDSTNTAVGAIAVRNLAINAPTDGLVLLRGTDAPMTVTFVNVGSEDDTLVSASTPAATSVDIVGPTSTVPIPRLSQAPSSYDLVLRGLTRDLPAASYITLTLDFQRNGTKQVLVPVRVPAAGAPRPSSTYEVPDTDSKGLPLGGESTPAAQ